MTLTVEAIEDAQEVAGFVRSLERRDENRVQNAEPSEQRACRYSGPPCRRNSERPERGGRDDEQCSCEPERDERLPCTTELPHVSQQLHTSGPRPREGVDVVTAHQRVCRTLEPERVVDENGAGY